MTHTLRRPVALAIGVLLTTTALSVVTSGPAGAAAPTVSWRFSDATVSAKATTTVIWTVKHPASRGNIVLQRTRGTSGRYVNLVALSKRTSTATASGRTKIKAPGQGRYSYRIVVHAANGTAKRISAPKRLYSYAAVSMGTLTGYSSNTAQIGGKLFRYVVGTYGTELRFDSTTCRAGRVSAGIRDGDSGSATVSFVEENGDGGSVSVPGPGVVYSGTIAIARGALSINASVAGDELFFNGTFSCWTPSGQ